MTVSADYLLPLKEADSAGKSHWESQPERRDGVQVAGSWGQQRSGRARMCKMWGCARCEGVQDARVCKMLLETVHWELSLWPLRIHRSAQPCTSSLQATLSRTTHPGQGGVLGYPCLGLLNCDHGIAHYLSELRSQNQTARGWTPTLPHTPSVSVSSSVKWGYR